MKPHILIIKTALLILLVFFLFFVPSDRAIISKPFTEIDKLLTSYNQQKNFLGVALIAHENKIQFQKTFNHSNKTIFRIGSLTKQFTALSILQLQEQEKLNVHDPISKHLPAYPKDTGNKITIHHLLTHSSGLPDYIKVPEAQPLYAKKNSPEKIIALFKDKPLEFEPGTKFKYNNSGYYLLGQIIEQVSGKQYEDYLKEFVFEKAGMKHTGLKAWKTLPSSKKTKGHNKDLTPNIYVDASFIHSAGGLYSTLEDMFLWYKAISNNSLINKKSKNLFFTPHITGTNFEEQVGYGYGWFASKHFGSNMRWHIGGAPGFNAFIGINLNTKTCVILLNNISIGFVKTRELAKRLYDFVEPRQENTPHSNSLPQGERGPSR